MKQVTTVLVAGGRINVAHLRTRLRIMTAGNVKSGHASKSVLRPWQTYILIITRFPAVSKLSESSKEIEGVSPTEVWSS